MATAHAPSVPRQEGVAGRQPRLAHKSERGAAELAGQVRQNKGGKATGQQSAQRQQRQQQYGLDCTDVVHFSQWEVNGEYTKQFTIKNVAMKTQKLRYKLPKSRIFSLDFPDAATLSAGMSWHITVTFRPSAKQEYDDSIEIVTSFGTFAIPLKATLPKHQLTFDQLLSFAFCPLLETAKQRFTLRNTGELPSTFEWAVERPFRIVPDKGELLPGGEAHLIAEFHPEAAYCLEAAATCTFGNRASWRSSKSSRSMQLTGVGKYPHLTITADEPDSGDCHVGAVHFSFGDVLVQSSYTRQFVLRNASPVPCRFAIQALDHQAGCFRCSTSGGVVPANSSMSLSITFTPTSVNASITERFVLQTSAGRRVQFSVGGRGLGAHVSISTTHLSFGEVELDSVGSKVLHIENHQKTPAHFQFLVEPMATFQFDKTSGTLPAQASAVITVHFAPSEPMNYCRSVYCLVEHQEPLTVNLLGTGYIANRRPYALTVTSLQRYRERVHKGLALYAPEQLESMIKSGWLEWRGNTLVWMRTPPPQIVERKHDDLNACEALFTVAAVSQDPAVIVEELVNFGSCTRYRYIEARAVHLRNNTKAKMTCAWQLPQLSDSNAPVFSVTPPMADLPPSGTVEFRVAFQPGQDGEYYEQQLECHVFFKNMRNFRFVNDDTFTPPWCLTISAVGNTAAGGQEGLVPQITFGTDDLDFVGCLVGQSTYRTMSVTNNGDTTVKCAFADWIDPEHNNTEAAPVFSARPSFRTLRPGERQLVLFRFSPQREHRYDCKLKCTFNDSTANYQSLSVRGAGAVPSVMVNDNKPIVFTPICINTCSRKSFNLTNTSCVAVAYQWCIPETYEDTVQVQPRSGVLEPNNTVVSACLFTPPDKRKYVVNISLQYSATEGEGQSTKKVSTTVLGEGAVAVVTCHPAAKQLNAVLVGAVEQSNFVTLENTGACDVHMALDIVDANGHAQDEIRCVGNTATVQRRSKLRVYLLVNIKDAKKTTFQLRYRIQSATQPVEPQQQQHWIKLCDIMAQGVLPCIQVVGVSSEELSSGLLNSFFDYQHLNALLQRPSALLNKEDSPETFDLAFGANLQHAPATTVRVTLHNPGAVGVEWRLCFPQDMEIEIEPWADPGEYSEEKLHHAYVVENKIFQVEPKTGCLPPGGSSAILLRYHHAHVGAHVLPVFFEQRQSASTAPGRAVMINFKGRTVAHGESFLQVQARLQSLRAVRVTDSVAPIQTCILENKGSVALDYSVDMIPFEQVSKENHGYAIFQCLRSQGHIEPGGRDMLQVIFSPAECRQYCIDVPIFVQDHLPTVVTLKAQGVLARSVERVLAPSTHDAFFDAPADVQPLRVSTHTVTFGKVVLHSVERQLIALTNITDSATMFRWQVAPGPVSIFPESGTLQPQAHIYCRVVCAPTTQPRIYDIDCSCTMVNAEQQARYDSWATAAESQRKARGGSPSLEQLPTGAKGRTVGKLKRTDMKSKYAALPPISPTSSRADLHSAGPRHGSSTPAVDAILSQPAQPKTFRTHVIVQVESTTGYTPSDEVFERPIQVIEEVPDPAFCVTVSEAMAELLEDAFHDLQVGQQASAIVAAKPSLDEIFGRVMSATQDESRRAARAVFFGSVPAHTLAADPAVQAELEDLLEECIYDTTLATFMQSG